jgi:hypothetical protein
LKIHYLGQKEGEHVGAGDPPSASEAVDIAKLSRMAARNKRVTFFISFSPRSLELILAGETLRVFEENGTHVRKACDFTRRKSASRSVIWTIRYLATTTLFSKMSSVNRRSSGRMPDLMDRANGKPNVKSQNFKHLGAESPRLGDRRKSDGHQQY